MTVSSETITGVVGSLLTNSIWVNPFWSHNLESEFLLIQFGVLVDQVGLSVN